VVDDCVTVAGAVSISLPMEFGGAATATTEAAGGAAGPAAGAGCVVFGAVCADTFISGSVSVSFSPPAFVFEV
jgi:hypothetical protein